MSTGVCEDGGRGRKGRALVEGRAVVLLAVCALALRLSESGLRGLDAAEVEALCVLVPGPHPGQWRPRAAATNHRGEPPLSQSQCPVPRSRSLAAHKARMSRPTTNCAPEAHSVPSLQASTLRLFSLRYVSSRYAAPSHCCTCFDVDRRRSDATVLPPPSTYCCYPRTKIGTPTRHALGPTLRIVHRGSQSASPVPRPSHVARVPVLARSLQ